MRRATVTLCLLLLVGTIAHGQGRRPTIGLALGGGSARGIAHIGVIKWCEEHHIPIDRIAGTSMGGLVGGAFASGMSAAELQTLMETTDWDMMFGSTPFRFKNIRRKEDARAYPSKIEFGLRGGLVAPTAISDGQQVDWLLARIAAPYYALTRFDDLPTPFRTVATDLKNAEAVVLDEGSLGVAMRATMSLPGVFPPVRLGDRVLVDGGAFNNVPADVVRTMGADVVIAIDVGYAPTDEIDYSLFGLMGQTIDSMMRANTRRGAGAADVSIAVDVAGFGSLDWRKSGELIARGYQGAEAKRDELIKYAVSDEEYRAWAAERNARRRTTLPSPAFVDTAGLAPADAARARQLLTPHLNTPLNLVRLQSDLAPLTGLDRYQSVSWEIIGPPGREGLLIVGRPKYYAPPFVMLGVNLTNTVSDDFTVQFAARYLTFDPLGSGSELRLDFGIGSDPSIGAALYEPLGRTSLFARAYGQLAAHTFSVVQNDAVIATYREGRVLGGAQLGVNLGRDSELAGGLQVGHLDTSVRAGDPGLPALSGAEVMIRTRWLLDTQDNIVVPKNGVRLQVRLDHTVQSPDVGVTTRTNDGLTQAEVTGSSFWQWRQRNRLFAVVGAGTSFDGRPLATEQFTLGTPFHLDAFDVGERRGDHYAVGTVGLLHQLARLPDFLGGPVFAGAWLQNGSAFDSHTNVDLHTQTGLGVIIDTIIGPVVLGTSFGFDGAWRTFFGIGRIIG